MQIIALVFLVSFLEIKAVFQTINQPGLYKLGEDITYSPLVPNDIIFQITSSNVVFDLGDHFIAQDPTNVQTGLIAIQVASGLSNVTIKSGINGSIQNIRGTGIQVLSNCSRIMLDNITTFLCNDRGIDFFGIPGAEITDSQIQNCNVIRCCQTPSGTIAVLLISCNRMQIKNVNVNANGTQNVSQSGMRIDSCLDCDFESVVMQDNIAANDLTNFLLVITSRCTFSNCLVENSTTTANASTSRAYRLSGASNNNIFKNCIAVSTAGNRGQSIGFEVLTCANNIFDHCLVEGSTGTATTGFLDNSSSMSTFLDCIARNNVSSSTARGFFATLSSNISFINCIASDQSSTAGIAVGFDMANATNPFMQKCITTRNNGTPVAGNSFGVRSSGSTNPVFVKNVASRNGTVAADQLSGVAAGAVNNVLATGVNSTTIGAWTNLGIT
jgi:hypothetical protein